MSPRRGRLTSRKSDVDLALRVRRGDYEVDVTAVADAIVRRRAARELAARLSRMLVALEPNPARPL